MKKKSTEGSIPFRESKLTHLLMPQLCRAGLAGVAMIACVNPQIDDYDETLSILGTFRIILLKNLYDDILRKIVLWISFQMIAFVNEEIHRYNVAS
jgi:hypothetical protein